MQVALALNNQELISKSIEISGDLSHFVETIQLLEPANSRLYMSKQSLSSEFEIVLAAP